jgi:uncharacterized protein
VTVAAIVETLAKEFAVRKEHAQRVLELLQTGHRAPFIARFRRAEIGDFTDGSIRRFARRLKEFEELDKRREVLLRSMHEPSRGAPPAPSFLAAVAACTDRFELEDLFLPLRRPEPEVQLAIDRGLSALADALVAPPPRGTPALDLAVAASPEETRETKTEEVKAEESSSEAPAAEPEAHEEEVIEESDSSEVHEPSVHAADGGATEAAEEPGAAGAAAPHARAPEPAGTRPAFHPAHIDLSPQLARTVAPHVNPDRGVHTEQQALEGAMRILSDRLGRDPALRTHLRRLLRKHGRVAVRALVDEGRLGRNRSLLKLNVPLRQLQGHRLIALRQAQAQRQVALLLTVDERAVLPHVRAALGRRIHPDHASVADEVARQALYLRLLPMIEDDVRNELRDRADEEAIRLVAQQLRQILLTPPAGPRPCAGVHIDAKGDWLIAVIGPDGSPQGAEIRLEASTLALPELAQKLNEAMRGTGVSSLAVAASKATRAGMQKLRATLELLEVEAAVVPVNDAGLASHANSEAGRAELGAHPVPMREAIGLARRHQDPLLEFLKLEPRLLGLGREQFVIGKSTLRRVLLDTIESCVAHVGCDLNQAPLAFLRHVPGLGFEQAKKLVERRAQRPFGSREELRTENLLDDLAWVNAIGFLRVRDSSEPLDRTALHPEQYDLARRVILQGGASVEETLGQRDAARGLRRADFEVDEFTWRDLVREISHPGRDPRPRQFVPRLLPVATDLKQLAKDQVVEGVVSSVASFGAFVDLGLERDAMVHVSEISSHYVRDARVLLSVGQVVRARVASASGPRVELSLKNVPDFRRGPHAPRRVERGAGEDGAGAPDSGPERRERGGRRGPRREGGETWPEYQPVLRAARSRRDGLVTGKGGGEKKRGGGGRGAREGSGFGAERGGGRGRGAGPREEYDADAVRRASRPTGSYNPFASFFKGQKPSEPELPPPVEEHAPPPPDV